MRTKESKPNRKKLQKRLNKKKQGDSSVEMFKLMLEEQKKANEEQKKPMNT